MEITSERVRIPLEGGGSMGGYLVRPKSGGPHPGVIVFMEIFGVNSHIRDVTERVAREGYVALAPDYFHRTGPGMELGYDNEGMSEGMKHLMQLKADQMISDAKAAIAYLRGRSDTTRKIGCMGFCIGGHMTYLTACTTDVAAAASYYGGGIAGAQGPGGGASTISRTPGIRGRIHCYFGGRDAMIPLSQVDAIRKALAAAGTRSEVVVYDEADHGFHCDQRASYHKPSAEDAWRRTLALFKQELSG
jgi:carboxymethylenebutenolidase